MKTSVTRTNTQKAAAILIIKKPGAMTEQKRIDISVWLHLQAERLAKEGKSYNDTGDYRARYMK